MKEEYLILIIFGLIVFCLWLREKLEEEKKKKERIIFIPTYPTYPTYIQGLDYQTMEYTLERYKK